MTRSYTQLDVKLLWGLSGGRCAICKREVASPMGSVPMGEMAHIIARERNGPRGNASYPPDNINSYENLLVLCPSDHAIVDGCPAEWPVGRLLETKASHERWVHDALEWADPKLRPSSGGRCLVILAGPSGVGKDVVINRVIDRLEMQGHDAFLLRRYTTRDPRPEEIPGAPFVYLSPDEFDAQYRSGVIACRHSSLGKLYGCDAHFCREATTAGAVFHSMRELKYLREMRDRAVWRGLKVLNILLTADDDTVRDRIHLRTASPSEKEERTRSGRQMLRQIEADREAIESFFDLVIDNSDASVIRNVVNKVTAQVDGLLRQLKSTQDKNLSRTTESDAPSD